MEYTMPTLVLIGSARNLVLEQGSEIACQEDNTTAPNTSRDAELW
jgi:hypothetical protein